MGWVSGIAVFVMVWWVVLFAVLPWGLHTRSEGDEDHDPDREKGYAYGAPKRPRLPLMLTVTTVLAIILWFIIFLVIEAELFSFRDWVAPS
jgi:predicted secreted protein